MRHPKVVIGRQLFFKCMHEMAPLFLQEWEEAIGDAHTEQELDIDWEKYIQLEMSGLLVMITARVDDKIVGWVITIIHPHLHFKSTLYGLTDSFYVLPEYREHPLVEELVDEYEVQMIEAGVKRINIASAPWPWLLKALKKLNYRKTECILAKWL
jgi:ribosomal protein S18 acetylase RimI-like enzyme